jgi:hypothetical protein
MKTIEIMLTVDEQGVATLRMPPDVPPGEHKVVMMIDETKVPRTPMVFSSHDVGPWPFNSNETFRREDLYGDDGR